MNENKFGIAVGLSIANRSSDVVKLINKHGGNITRATPKDKIYSLVKSFVKSNRQFAIEYLNLLVKENYLSPLDLKLEGNLDNNSQYSNFAITGALLSQAVPMITGFFKKPTVDSTAINTILEIEAEKEKNKKTNNAKYWIIGSAIVGLLTITTIIIIKKS